VKRIVWTALLAMLLAAAALATVVLSTDNDETAMVLIGSSITMAILSLREER
jgi:putative Ca2+/H+ antiporter (TMEM165/GDT1 family)